MDLTPNEIRERITMTIACSSPEMIPEIPGRVRGYITYLEEAMAKCTICGGVTIACPNCLRADETLVWIQHSLKKIENGGQGK